MSFINHKTKFYIEIILRLGLHRFSNIIATFQFENMPRNSHFPVNMKLLKHEVPKSSLFDKPVKKTNDVTHYGLKK